jgi:hypothetical protein
MCTDEEFAAAQWLTTQIPALNNATVRRGTVQDDWDVRDVWLDVPGFEPRSMGVRAREAVCVSRDFAIRLAVRMKDGTYKKTEFFKLQDRSRQCCHLYLQRWELYSTDEHEYVLVNMRKMRDLGFFGDEKRDLWSGPYLTANKDAYFTDLPLIHLIEADCVLKCRTHNRLQIGSPDLDAHIHPDTPLKWYSV